MSNILRKIRKHKPETLQEFIDLGCTLRLLSSGAFRSAFLIKGTGYVVKFSDGSDDWHLSSEMAAIKRINKLKRLEPLRRLLPKVYYTDFRNGISVVKYYKLLGNSFEDDMIRKGLSRYVGNFLGFSAEDDCSDVENEGNVARDKRGNLKIIDLGCFEV